MTNFSLFDTLDGSHSDNIFLTNNQHIVQWVEKIEKLMLETPRGVIYAGYQQASLFKPRLRLYNRLARIHAVHLYVHLDIELDELSPQIHLHNLDQKSLLAEEWFVIANTPDYRRGIIAKEIFHQSDQKSKYHGVLLSNQSQLVDLIEHLNLASIVR